MIYLRACMLWQVFDVELVFFVFFKGQFTNTLGQGSHITVKAILHWQVTVDTLEWSAEARVKHATVDERCNGG